MIVFLRTMVVNPNQQHALDVVPRQAHWPGGVRRRRICRSRFRRTTLIGDAKEKTVTVIGCAVANDHAEIHRYADSAGAAVPGRAVRQAQTIKADALFNAIRNRPADFRSDQRSIPHAESSRRHTNPRIDPASNASPLSIAACANRCWPLACAAGRLRSARPGQARATPAARALRAGWIGSPTRNRAWAIGPPTTAAIPPP